MSKKQIYALMDANSFFCSCEILFAPQYMGRPVVVLSNNDGCIISLNREAKQLGFEMCSPYFKVQQKIKKYKVGVFSSNFSIYSDISSRMMRILAEMAPQIEVYSIDEAFLDLTDHDYFNLHEYGNRIKSRIEKEVGVPVCIGIGETKTLAKLANRIAKKDSSHKGVVSLLDSGEWGDQKLSEIEVADIWGIGNASELKLKLLGIKTAKDFRDYKNDKLIRKMFSIKGLQTQKELQGISCLDISVDKQKKKQIICSRTFGGTVYDLTALNQAVASYVSNAMEKLRSQQSLCGELSIFFRTSPHHDITQHYVFDSHKFTSATCDTNKAINVALKLVKKKFVYGIQYKKAGVVLSRFVDKEGYQVSLFDNGDADKNKKLMKVIDQVNYSVGAGTLYFAACGVDNSAFRMSRKFKSSRFTTSWHELPRL